MDIIVIEGVVLDRVPFQSMSITSVLLLDCGDGVFW